MCKNFPEDYNYDDYFGVKVLYQDKGDRKTIDISPEEIKAPTKDSGPILFRHFEQMYRDRISVALPKCAGTQPEKNSAD
jgi:hypothetical protein